MCVRGGWGWEREKFLIVINGPFFIISSPPNFHIVYVNAFGKVVLKVKLLGEKAARRSTMVWFKRDCVLERTGTIL